MAQTGTATRKNAKESVRMLIMNSSLPTGVRAATSATTTPTMVIRSGVPVRGLVALPSIGGGGRSP